MNHADVLPLACAALLSSGLMACGPSQVHIEPRSVTALHLKVPTREATFCPGEPIRVEVRADLKDGSQCSNSDAQISCMGDKGALIDASELRLEGTRGASGRSGDDLFWTPPRDALATAERGLSLRAWIESGGEKGAVERSPIGQIELRPVYDCLQENTFTMPPPRVPGQSGVTGPDLKVMATMTSTPFYPEAMLIRVETSAGRTYILATDRNKPITIYSKGQSGADGRPGRSGSNGPDGADASVFTSGKGCDPGKPGMNGLDGAPGGNGGSGGPGGSVQLFIDEAAADKIQGWLKVGSVGGDAGRGGQGGAGGLGGRGGTHSDVAGCAASDGRPGKSGMRAPAGDPGRPGAGGPDPTVATASRQALFADDLPVLQQIEAAARQRP